MSSLLPLNHTDLERDLEIVSARISEVPVPVRDVWNADTCPVELLPFLAWALSIESWKSYWPEDIKRGRIRNAIEIQKHKGSRKAVYEVVKSFGAEVQLEEWFDQQPMGAPHSFNVALNINEMGAQTAAVTRDIIQEVIRVKAVRSYFELQQRVSFEGELGIHGQVRIAKFVRLNATDQD